MAKLDAVSHQWVASLANYNFQLYYQAGNTNINADDLLRVSWPWCMPANSGTHLQVTAVVVWAVQEAALKGPTSPIEAYNCDLHILDSVQDSQQVTCMTIEDWHQAQQVDPTLSLVITRLWDGTLGQWQSKQTDSPELNQFLHEWNYLLLQKGVLYRSAIPRESKETLFQLVLLAAPREVVLRGCHDEVGHLGLECMLDLMCDQFYWPCMAAQARNTLTSATYALLSRPSSPGKHCGQTSLRACPPWLPVSGAWERSGGECPSGNKPLYLVCPSLCYPIPDHQTTAKTLRNTFTAHYGLPEKILSDQGRNFESQLVADLCKLMGIQKLQTSLYHPQTNGQCERFNSTMIGMLGTLLPEGKSDWKNILGC